MLREKAQKKFNSKYFKEWLVLYKYYSSFTKSDYCYTQKKHSDLHFAKKWFDRLKIYNQARKIHNYNKIKADSVYF